MIFSSALAPKSRLRLGYIAILASLVLLLSANSAFAALSAPTPLSPAKAQPVWKAPQLSWSPVTGATKYRVEIASDPDMSDVIISYSDIRNSSIMPPDSIFSDSTVYYWAVFAGTDAGTESAASATWSFKRQFSRPSQTTPADAATVREIPTFSWTSVVNAFQYDFEICSDLDCTDVVFGSTVAGNQITPQGLDWHAYHDQLLYWRVRWAEGSFAGDAGEAGPWSVTRSFTRNFAYGLSTAVLSPADGLAAGLLPPFSWSYFPGASTYELVIAKDMELQNRLITFNGIVNNSVTPSDDYGLTPDTYYWSVTPYDSTGNDGPPSAVRTFGHTGEPSATVGTLPSAPALLSPADEAPTSDAPAVSWSPVAGAVKYEVEFASDPGFITDDVVRSVYTTSLTPTDNSLLSNILSAGTYYWRVKGVDELDVTGDWSATRTFIKTLMPAPVLVSPASAAIVTSGSGLLDWEAVPGAVQYEVYLSNSPLFDAESILPLALAGNYSITVASTAIHATDDFDPAKALAPGTWYWKVVGLDALSNQQSASVVRSFVKAKYPAPTLTSPAPGTLGVDAPILRWNGVSGIGLYDVQISPSSDFSTGNIKRVPSNSITAAPDLDYQKRLGNGTWYWRVRAVDLDLNAGNWSAGRTLVRYRSLYQDNSSSVAYAHRKEESAASFGGTWATSTSTNYSKSRAKVSSTRNASATFSFTGSRFTLLGTKGKSYGKAKIYVDGVYKTTVDAYSTTAKYQQALYSKSGLSTGTHTVKIVVTRTKSTSATGYQIGVDAIEYPSSWTASSKSSYLGGTSRLSSEAGKRATLSFRGNGVAWYASKGPAYGKAQVFVDGKSKGTIDLYAASTVHKKAVYEVGGLPWGDHKIAIAVLGSKNSSATAAVVPLDALITY